MNKSLFVLLFILSLLVAACNSSAKLVANQPSAVSSPKRTDAPATESLTKVPAAAPANSNIILATTTSTQDSGLLDVLVPLFEAETGYTVQTVAVGTGQALRMGEEGNADVLLVHAPKSEEAFMQAGFGKDRAPVMHNDFIIVGTESDPVQIKGTASAIDALKMIYHSGSLFISRGDDSGTHKKELDIWVKAELDPKGQAWYLESGQGMGATLTIASEKDAYTITDRGTFLAQQNNLDLVIILEGDPPLQNPYHVITVNPHKWPNINYDGALAFYKFMTTPEIQNVIAEFGVKEYGQPLFFPDAQ
ncbi:MAG: substrate-binding domain-containing protein [Anaerolineales bacterium]|nr:substrate-binding domain-containing protein [Anaerolineales bacterium]MDP2776411.1 substrate-binding domain-containing protein [Anaerolineales bacterium]